MIGFVKRLMARLKSRHADRRQEPWSPQSQSPPDYCADSEPARRIRIPEGSPGLPVINPFLKPCAAVMPLQLFHAEYLLSRLGVRKLPLRLHHILAQISVTAAVHIFVDELGFEHDALLIDPVARGKFRMLVDRLVDVDEFLRSHHLPYLDQSPLASALAEDDWPLYAERLTFYKSLCRMRRDAELRSSLPQGYARFIEKHLPAMYRNWQLARPKSDDTTELAAQWAHFEEQRIAFLDRCQRAMRETEVRVPKSGPKTARTYAHLQHTCRSLCDQVLMALTPDAELIEQLSDITCALEEFQIRAKGFEREESQGRAQRAGKPLTVADSLAELDLGLTAQEYAQLSSQERAQRVKSAYRAQAQRWHPDKGGDVSKFKAITDAYEFLFPKHKSNSRST